MTQISLTLYKRFFALQVISKFSTADKDTEKAIEIYQDTKCWTIWQSVSMNVASNEISVRVNEEEVHFQQNVGFLKDVKKVVIGGSTSKYIFLVAHFFLVLKNTNYFSSE